MKAIHFLWALIIVILITYSMGYYFSIPVVHWSTSSDECVKIIYNGVESDCGEMPEEYERIWVK